MAVQPASTQEDDIANAKVCKNILDSTSEKIGLSNIVSEVTRWSEICGTGFYKVVWNDSLGSVIGMDEHGNNIKDGDVDIMACSHFEIFPDRRNSPA